jgi:hypothetical protein
MNPYLQEILHDITTRLAKLEAIEPTIDGWPLWSGLPLPKKEWVGLTDEEIHEIRIKTLDSVATNYEAYRAIEAKLKEKNA